MNREYTERVELHCHSRYSAGDSTARPHRILERAHELGMRAIAITDHGNVEAFPEMEQAIFLRKEHARPIYGMEAYVVDDRQREVTQEENEGPIYHLTILVKNEDGKRNLYELVNDSFLKYRRDNKPIIPLTHLLMKREGLLLGSACSAGLLFEKVLGKAPEEELLELTSLYDFIEVQPVMNQEYLVDLGVLSDIKDLKDINLRLIELAKKCCKPAVATGDAHCLICEDMLARDILHSYVELSGAADFSICSTAKMLECFDYLSEEEAYEVVIYNSNMIANQCEELEIVPKETWHPVVRDGMRRIRAFCKKTLPQKYEASRIEEAKNYLEWELSAIQNTDMSFLFLLVRELLTKTGLRACDISTRGCVGSSIVAYLMGITDIDPIYHGLSPEFLYGSGQDRTISFDINIPSKYEETVSRALETLEGISAIQRLGNPQGYEEEEVRSILDKYEKLKGASLSGEERSRAEELIENAMKGVSLHPYGYLLVPEDHAITELCPLCVTNEGRVVPQFMNYTCDEVFYRLNLLPHEEIGMLTALSQETGVDLATIPTEDEEILEMFYASDRKSAEPRAAGIADFKTVYSFDLLRKLRPKTFRELCSFISLLHGTNTWLDNGEKLVEEGATLNELITTREDVFEYVLALGFTREIAYEIANNIRMGKAKRGRYKKWPERKEQLLEAGADPSFVWSCEQVSYLFPRAHSISYQQMHMRMAWFKKHYPGAYEKIRIREEYWGQKRG